MYQIMFRSIDLYGQGVAALKKIGTMASDLTERLSLPEDALLGAARLTVVGKRKTLIENHRGILEYGTEYIVVSTGRGKISLTGSGMKLLAMNKSELLISGEIKTVEWE